MSRSRGTSWNTNSNSSPFNERSSSGIRNSFEELCSLRKASTNTCPTTPVASAAHFYEVDSDVDVPEEEDFENGVTYMAALKLGNKLGIAYYNTSAETLSMIETYEDASNKSLALVKHQASPGAIYTSTKMHEEFLIALESALSAEGDPYQVKLCPSSIFSYEKAKQRLMFLRIQGMRESRTEMEHFQQLSSMINWESDMQVRAAGALVAILQEETVLDESGSSIARISQLSLDGLLQLDSASYEALQIFHTDKHPSRMGIGSPKEGLSVFGIFNQCVTSAGRQMLKLWFMRPILDLEIINDRLNTVSKPVSSSRADSKREYISKMDPPLEPISKAII